MHTRVSLYKTRHTLIEMHWLQSHDSCFIFWLRKYCPLISSLVLIHVLFTLVILITNRGLISFISYCDTWLSQIAITYCRYLEGLQWCLITLVSLDFIRLCDDVLNTVFQYKEWPCISFTESDLFQHNRRKEGGGKREWGVRGTWVEEGGWEW